MNSHEVERMGRILTDREWGVGWVGHSLQRQWLGLRHESRGEIRLIYFNKEVEIKKAIAG